MVRGVFFRSEKGRKRRRGRRQESVNCLLTHGHSEIKAGLVKVSIEKKPVKLNAHAVAKVY